MVVGSFPLGLVLLALLALALGLGYEGLRRKGHERSIAFALAGLALLTAVALVLIEGMLLGLVVLAALAGLLAYLATRAFRVKGRLDPAQPPRHPIVVYNPKSGGGKAIKFNLAEEARKRGIEPIELKPGDDLVVLVKDAVARGADGLAAAGGDGTQALVATIAAEHDLPFACIPAGTRNHFALDLGVDRDDVVGALDAFVNGGERRVDLAEVNGRIFVNNASLGLYAEAVQKQGYRDAKIRTILETAPEVLAGPGAVPQAGADAALVFTGPNGTVLSGAVVVLVSNNTYRLGRLLGSGTRPRIDDGVLGIAAMVLPGVNGDEPRRPWLQWSELEFTVQADGLVPIGVDGEALQMAGPLRFRALPGALRVRIAPQHPGASPSASEPSNLREGWRTLLEIITGKVDEYGRRVS